LIVNEVKWVSLYISAVNLSVFDKKSDAWYRYTA
jgi:hypothetical protein